MTEQESSEVGKLSRRTFIRGAAAAGGVAGFSGHSLAGCTCETPGKDQPGKENGEADGHKQDVSDGDPAGSTHDDDYHDSDEPGQRIGHCKYDPDGDGN